MSTLTETVGYEVIHHWPNGGETVYEQGITDRHDADMAAAIAVARWGEWGEGHRFSVVERRVSRAMVATFPQDRSAS